MSVTDSLNRSHTHTHTHTHNTTHTNKQTNKQTHYSTFLLVAAVAMYAHRQGVDLLNVIRDPSVAKKDPISRARDRIAPLVPERASHFLASPPLPTSRLRTSHPTTIYDKLSPILSVRPLGLQRYVTAG
jgi:hypothetical protein